MADSKRYYWLKLYDDFFGSKRIKKLRKMAGGDTYLIIYLKLQLKAMKTEGVIQFDGLEQTIAEELALDLDEAPDDVKVTLSYLVSCGLAETNDEASFMFFPYAVTNTCSEGSDAQKKREARSKIKLLSEISATTSGQLPDNVRTMSGQRPGEIEKEIETRDKSKRETGGQLTPPTLEEVKAFCAERGNKVDAQRFYEYYARGGWIDGKGEPVRNWQQKAISWERGETGRRSAAKKPFDEREITDADFEAGYYADIMTRPTAGGAAG